MYILFSKCGKRVFVVIILVLFTLAVGRNIVSRADVSRHESCTYVDSIVGPKVDIKINHHEVIEPWSCYFGTNVTEQEVVDSFYAQKNVLSIQSISKSNSKGDRYLLSVESNLGTLYQELYVMNEPFVNNKGKNSYLLRDSLKLVYQGEDTFYILFPCAILDYDTTIIRDEADEFWKDNLEWKYQNEFLHEGKNLLEFLFSFYRGVGFYEVSKDNNGLAVTFNRDTIDNDSLTQHQKHLLSRLYQKPFRIELDEAKKELKIRLSV